MQIIKNLSNLISSQKHVVVEWILWAEAFNSLVASTKHSLDCWRNDSFCSRWCYNICFVPSTINLLQCYLH